MKKIDIIMPVIEKDLDVLPYALKSALKYVHHPIGEIMIVAPESIRIKKFCLSHNCRFIDENSVLPITKKDIVYKAMRGKVLEDRSGWLFQQLLKLGGDLLCSHEGYLVLDADTVLIKPHVFDIQGKSVFYIRRACHRPYFETYERLLKEKPLAPPHRISFIAHHMYFKKKRVGELKRLIETRHQKDWYAAVIDCTDKNNLVAFSEFETYGNFMLSRYAEQMLFKKWSNISLKRYRIHDIVKIDTARLASKGICSVSFHSYNS